MATKINKKDYKFMNPGGVADADFSPEHNKAVVERTIARYNALKAQKTKEYHNKLAERGDAAASYLKHIDMGKSTSVENYFGRQELARLRGQSILTEALDRRNKLRKLSEVR
jgi:hypothetical protein